MTPGTPSEIGGYVLAGGKSSRMGRDKALLELGGKPLVLHAVVKLRRVCLEVNVLGDNPALDAYAPQVKDLHPGCGPMGGMEAALAHSRYDWNLFLPVDVPFVPSAYLSGWVRHTLPLAETRVRMFTVDGMPQPTLAMVHREVRPFLTEALERGEYKLLPVLERACVEISVAKGLPPGVGMWKIPYWSGFTSKPGPQRKGEDWQYTTEAQERGSGRWFANLNTPEEFAEAERNLDALDT
ncbi:molybdenum cofactor guanylyltransferase [Granulicella sp. S190]|uniref:molybdenum cofactor guanylyltransferase n=1 Tax=Granulicella sp. S190 TaxID=1747226 RepID=UPI00131BAF2A|nr:molybdenum cofactor guanylyltransferase [Granulicella sp. S190]